MVTDAVREILGTFATVDTEAGELAAVLNAAAPPEWRERFRAELADALRSGDLTPDAADDIMFRDFPDQAALDHWMRDAWAQWFPGEPYPVTAAG